MRGWLLATVFGLAGVAVGVAVAPWVRPGAAPAAERAAIAGSEAQEQAAPVASDRQADPSQRQALAAKMAAAASSLEVARQVAVAQATARRDVTVPLESAPPAVRAALTRWWKGKPAEEIRIRRKQRDQGPTFETQYVQDGVEYELDFDPGGKLLKGEVNMAPSELPANVLQGLQARFPDALVYEVEKVVGDNGQTLGYEVDVRAGGQMHEVNVSPEGQAVNDRRR